MKQPSKIRTHHLLSLLLVLLVLLACNLASVSTSSPANTPNQSPSAATQVSGQAEPTAVTATTETDPLDRLLTMRSIKFNLTSLKWDGTSDSIGVEIDSAGNMHVKHSLPAPNPDDLPEGFDTTKLPTSYEMYVVDGKAYTPSDENPNWMASPVDEKYLQTLSGEMHGPFSPAIWLDLLPLGSINASGKDTVGGFAADKYNVNGQVAGQSVTGTIWFEPQADALVQAELHIPAALLSDPDQAQQGELKVTLNAQKSDIPLVTLPNASAGLPGATATTTVVGTPSGSGALAIHDSYPLDVANGVMGISLTTSPGKVWVGTGRGTIEKVDTQSGAFEQSFSLTGTKIDLESLTIDNIVGAVIKLGFDGEYIAATMILNDQIPPHRYLFIIDTDKGAVVHQWDLQSTEWSSDIATFPDDFGVSPGKIWLDGHMIDTQNFEVRKDIPNPRGSHFAYNGNGWMWITGDTGGSCDDLVFIDTDDPDKVICQNHLPFMNNSGDKIGSVYVGSSIMALAGDRMWMAASGGGEGNQNMTIVAYPADMGQLMKETKPLTTVRLMNKGSQFGLLYAGNFLWLLWKGSDERGFLYQLDPQTGATINSLDLVGDQGRKKGDIPQDFATEGDNLWILTRYQLLRIILP
jgi:hypothetical protein